MGDPGVKAGRRILVVEDDLVIADADSRRLVSQVRRRSVMLPG
jgi:hypothetical protein